MSFDATAYEAFLKAHRVPRNPPSDLIERYAITLTPATTDAEIKAQVDAVRSYWNNIMNGAAGTARTARWCHDQDEALRKEHGPKIETATWWRDAQQANSRQSQEQIVQLAANLRQVFGELGAVTQDALAKAADRRGLSAAEAGQAAQRAGLSVIDEKKITLPDASPLGGPKFKELLNNLSVCKVATIPELVHPGSGTFRIVERYECVNDPIKLRLDVVAVQTQLKAAGESNSAASTARQSALRKLRDVAVNLQDAQVNRVMRDVALHHLISLVEDAAAPVIAKQDLERVGVDATDAGIIAALLAGRQTGRVQESGGDKVRSHLENAELREAVNLLDTLSDEDKAALQPLVAAKQRELADLLAKAEAAQQSGDEAVAEQHLRDAQLISSEDAARRRALLPPPPPVNLRVSGDGPQVMVFWDPGPGHDASTVYAVTRTLDRPPDAPGDGFRVHLGPGTECADPSAPVATTVQYGVFTVVAGRPTSRPAIKVVTPVPPVRELSATVGIAAVTLSWQVGPEAEVRVTRAASGADPVSVPVTGNSLRLTGLPDGVPQRFEVVAVYRGAGGAELTSHPEPIIVTPRGEAKPIKTLQATPVQARGGLTEVLATWQQVDSSEVSLLHTAAPPPWPEGHTITREDAGRIGQLVTGHIEVDGKACSMQVTLPGGMHYLTPLSEGGAGTVVGKTRPVAIIPPVTDLVATPFSDYATIAWTWPEAIQLAQVVATVDGEETPAVLTHAQYQEQGGARVQLGAGPCKVEVCALLADGSRRFASPPAFVTVQRALKTAIRWQVSGAPFSRTKKLTFTAEGPCAGVVVGIVAAQGTIMPTRPGDGVTVLETTLNLAPGVPAEYKAEIPKIKKPYWVRCFIISGPGRLTDPPVKDMKED
jgi:hypothetical protein